MTFSFTYVNERKIDVNEIIEGSCFQHGHFFAMLEAIAEGIEQKYAQEYIIT